ncbi:ribosome maturation factor RimP [Agrilactobacillus fermenti]|uniref:ribosome maturation factor RimP n=1 Tax=Agrilactobacillus fermenti TaxID=2586909 RepID=UPI001E28C2E0|nr:ribosome maturation factor RimP [Agrilactobacillus fermenti]MCD2256258.1 ribosome maturation factor RimP [Agrilactobacillus fermenti]
MSDVVQVVTDIVQPILDGHKFQLVDIEYVKEGHSWYLRVYIDKPGGIDIEECAMVSEQLSEQLDQLDPDPIPQAYFLEVSSPGAERPLKTETDIQNAIGEYVHISLYQQVHNAKIFEGTLVSVDQNQLTLELKDKTRKIQRTFQRDNIAKIRLAIEF